MITGYSATIGEKRLERLLQQLPQTEFIAFPQPRIDRNEQTSTNPDFLLVWKSKGILAIEVKDWLEITGGDSRKVTIQQRSGEKRSTTNPFQTARSYALDLKERLETYRDFMTEIRGSEKLSFPCEGLVVLSAFSMSTVSGLEDAGIFPENAVLSGDDLLNVEALVKALNRIRWTFPLSRQIADSTIEAFEKYLNLVRVDVPVKLRGDTVLETKGNLTPDQERVLWLPFEKIRAGHNIHLLRGPVGCGKTVVLSKRAMRCAEARPDWKVLVTSFHIDIADDLRRRIPQPTIDVKKFYAICEEILGENYPRVKDYRGELGPLAIRDWTKQIGDEIKGLGLTPDFIASEIGRRKDAQLYDIAEYSEDLKRRHKWLNEDQREWLNEIFFELYQSYQKEEAAHGNDARDWEDLIVLTKDALRNHKMRQLYDAIFIDEAQDFSPMMMEVIKRLLVPGGYLFLTDDPVQCLWRRFNWADRNVKPNRTDTLGTPLRTTISVFNLAQCLLDEHPMMRAENDTDLYPATPGEQVETGEMPQLKQFDTEDSECEFIDKTLQSLLDNGIDAAQIAVFFPRYNGFKERWKERDVSFQQVFVSTFGRIKGLEFEVVIIPELNQMFKLMPARDRDNMVLSLRQLFVAITRARKQVYLSYCGTLPEQLACLRYFCVE